MNRAQMEAMLDATAWAWDMGLSMLLDQAILADEQAAP